MAAQGFSYFSMCRAPAFSCGGGMYPQTVYPKGPAELDYLIVLGAQMKTGGPSKALQYRLDEACRYLDENPGIKVIVSGGQGTDEPVSEAQGMYDYLAGNM